MKIKKEIFEPNLFFGEEFGTPFWSWENLKFDDREGRNCYVGEVPKKDKQRLSYHCGKDKNTQLYGIINSNYEVIVPFEFSFIEPKNPYFCRDFIKKDTYYFYVWKNKKVGLYKIENNQLEELIEPNYIKIEQTEQIDFYQCRTKDHCNLYNLLNEKLIFKNDQYSKIEFTPFSISMFNLYKNNKCVLYDHLKNEVVISDLQDVYFFNDIGSYKKRTGMKIFGLNENVLTQYNLDSFEKEELEIDAEEMKFHKIACIKACGISRKYQKLVIEKYF